MKFNKFDIVVSLVLLGFLFVAGYSQLVSSNIFAVGNVPIEYNVIIFPTRQMAIDHYEIGQEVFTQTTEELVGKISKIEVKPYKELQVHNGTGIEVENPEYFELHLTIESQGRVSEKGIFAGESFRIASGHNVQFQTMYVRFNATIGDIHVPINSTVGN